MANKIFSNEFGAKVDGVLNSKPVKTYDRVKRKVLIGIILTEIIASIIIVLSK